MNWKLAVIVLLILSATTVVATATASLDASMPDRVSTLDVRTTDFDHLQLKGDPIGDPGVPH